MIRTLVFILFFLPVAAFAQYTIKGRVLNSTDKSPVANASVFLNNSVAGSKTDDNGLYKITFVRPGQYDLVVSCVGYETVHQNIIVNGDLQLADISLPPKIMMLDEVHIKPRTGWAQNYALFKQYFFGTSKFAQMCRITTKGMPDILDLDRDSKTGVFTAKSTDYFEIENRALGYKIRYFLQDMTSEPSGHFYYEGTAAFEELKGSSSEIRRWKKNRKEAYEGSSMHFLRCVVGNELTNEGFKVLRLIRKVDTVHKNNNDKAFSTLVNTPLKTAEFASRTTVTGEYALNFKDCLYVMYNKQKAAKGKPVPADWASTGWDDAQITTLIFSEPYTYFDNNGIIINPASVAFDGNWGRRLMGELLPVDYVE